jgi:hypothetical protein
MRAYWELAVTGYRRKAAYRGATFAGAFTNSVFGLIRGSVLLALMHARGTVGGYDAADALAYVWLGQGMIAVVELWGWVDVAERVASGDIAVDLGARSTSRASGWRWMRAGHCTSCCSAACPRLWWGWSCSISACRRRWTPDWGSSHRWRWRWC